MINELPPLPVEVAGAKVVRDILAFILINYGIANRPRTRTGRVYRADAIAVVGRAKSLQLSKRRTPVGVV